MGIQLDAERDRQNKRNRERKKLKVREFDGGWGINRSLATNLFWT